MQGWLSITSGYLFCISNTQREHSKPKAKLENIETYRSCLQSTNVNSSHWTVCWLPPSLWHHWPGIHAPRSNQVSISTSSIAKGATTHAHLISKLSEEHVLEEFARFLFFLSGMPGTILSKERIDSTLMFCQCRHRLGQRPIWEGIALRRHWRQKVSVWACLSSWGGVKSCAEATCCQKPTISKSPLQNVLGLTKNMEHRTINYQLLLLRQFLLEKSWHVVFLCFLRSRNKEIGWRPKASMRPSKRHIWESPSVGWVGLAPSRLTAATMLFQHYFVFWNAPMFLKPRTMACRNP